MGSIPACAGEPPRGSSPRLARTVYPRVCGGTQGSRDMDLAEWGLSPRVRGNHFESLGIDQIYGSIPACAGEPSYRAAGYIVSGVYPRVCGGTGVLSRDEETQEGLSPRVRGNRLASCSLYMPRRSIPACAGEPSTLWRQIEPLRVYPRVCGGTRQPGHSAPMIYGLSPRVRGNHGNGCLVMALDRSIPACAGEPEAFLGVELVQGVYPRVCGGTVVAALTRWV